MNAYTSDTTVQKELGGWKSDAAMAIYDRAAEAEEVREEAAVIRHRMFNDLGVPLEALDDGDDDIDVAEEDAEEEVD